MAQVGSYEAKTNLPRLLARVERGETITITRHGRPVAVLSPIAGGRARTVDESIDALRGLRRGRTLGGVRIRDLIADGRK